MPNTINENKDQTKDSNKYHNKPYFYSDDTSLLLEVVRNLRGKRCIEIGSGNCYILEELSKNFEIAVGTDLVKPSSKKNGVEFFLADRATCFRDLSFDVSVCNPPYLPSDSIDDIATDSGKDSEQVMKFTEDGMRVIKEGGSLYILISSLTNQKKIEEEWRAKGYNITQVKEKKLFFETLYVYRLTKENKK